jgi:hypothetical protein
VKDPYKKLSHEWGSKRRKADSRQAKSTLKKPTKEELEEPTKEELEDTALNSWYESIGDDDWEDVTVDQAFRAGFQAGGKK